MWDDCYNYNEYYEAIIQSRLVDNPYVWRVSTTVSTIPSSFNGQWDIASKQTPKYNDVTIHEED